MDKAEFLALAERIEGLTQSCREADALIARAICWRWEGWEEGDRKIEEMDLHVLHERVENSHNSIWRNLPAYTASLDAAMALVPEGFKVNEFFQQSQYDWRWRCWLLRPMDAESYGHSFQPALAITAAALRAHASAMEGEG